MMKNSKIQLEATSTNSGHVSLTYLQWIEPLGQQKQSCSNQDGDRIVICSGIFTEWLFIHCFQTEFKLEILVFLDGENLENQEGNPLEPG